MKLKSHRFVNDVKYPVLKEWEQVLSKYLLLQKRYAEVMDDEDVAFDYTEMTAIGQLSAAASICGWTTLCEFQHDKKSKTDGRKDSHGRCDIYLAYKKAGKFRDYFCEAKYKRLELTDALNRQEWQETLRPVQNDAKADTLRTCNVRKSRNHRGIALSFISIYLKNKHIHNQANVRDSLFKYIKNNPTRIHGAAISFLETPMDSWYANSKISGSALLLEKV